MISNSGGWPAGTMNALRYRWPSRDRAAMARSSLHFTGAPSPGQDRLDRASHDVRGLVDYLQRCHQRGLDVSDVVLESVIRPRASTSRATASCIRCLVPYWPRSRTSSTAVSAPTDRTSPTAPKRSAQSAESGTGALFNRHDVIQHACRVSSSRVASAAAQPAGSHAQVLPVETSSNDPSTRSDPSTAPIGATPPLKALAQADEVGLDADPFHGEKRAAPAAACLHLVGAQQPVVLGAQLGQGGEERGRRHHHAAGAEHRLDDDARDIRRVDRMEQDVVAQVVDGGIAGAAGRGAANGLR